MGSKLKWQKIPLVLRIRKDEQAFAATGEFAGTGVFGDCGPAYFLAVLDGYFEDVHGDGLSLFCCFWGHYSTWSNLFRQSGRGASYDRISSSLNDLTGE